MKKVYGLLFLFFLTFSLCGQTRAFKISPFGMLFGHINIKYESKIKDRNSILLGINRKVLDQYPVIIPKYGGFIDFRLYRHNKITGVFISAGVSMNKFADLGFFRTGEARENWKIGIRPSLGFQFIIIEGFIIDLHLGMGINKRFERNELTQHKWWPLPFINTSFGFAI